MITLACCINWDFRAGCYHEHDDLAFARARDGRISSQECVDGISDTKF